MPPESEAEANEMATNGLTKRTKSNSITKDDDSPPSEVVNSSLISTSHSNGSPGRGSIASLRKWLEFHELPEWLKDNDCLLSRHRPPTPSVRGCVRSIFGIHSETGNIWTHLFGVILFICLGIELYINSGRDLPPMDKLMFGIYFFSAIGCLSFSTIYHTLSCHSHSVAGVCKGLDYCGIAIMITGSFMSYLYYAFFCAPISQLVYQIVSPVAGISVAAVALWPKMGRPEFRAIRATVFIVFGLSSVIPVIHLLFLDDTEVNHLSLILMAALYIGGAALYANRIPERFWPGKCDILFQSHQIFHVCVVLAALVQYKNLHNAAALRKYGLHVCQIHPLPTSV